MSAIWVFLPKLDAPHQTSAPVDEHLADQLLLSAALAREKIEYRVAEVSLHLTTNAAVIEQFRLARVMVDDVEKIVVVEPIIKIK